jgi:ubiquinone/menaquinone biosynthesis C-methylase UbiE
VAERNLRALNVSNVRLLEGELDALLLDDDSVDALTAASGLFAAARMYESHPRVTGRAQD